MGTATVFGSNDPRCQRPSKSRNFVVDNICIVGASTRASPGPPGECGDSQCQGQDWARSARPPSPARCASLGGDFDAGSGRRPTLPSPFSGAVRGGC
ncbi:hypothetical protein MTP99_011399 [Tenebrio molitor]|nr:hypothetical protein MTP99_011399 [Tenebrio molitor]